MTDCSVPTKLMTTHTKFVDLWFRFVILCVLYIYDALGIRVRELNKGIKQ
jgi:hypothetical protein